MKTAEWVSLVNGTPSGADVVQLCVKFLSEWGAERRRALPTGCEPPFNMHTVAHVMDYAFQLVQTRLHEERPSEELDTMATFFAAAATRLAQLLATKPAGTYAPFFMQDT
jgi:hypothetical protein